MPVHEIKGNLLDSDCKILFHGCNCFHTFGAGVAKAIAKKYPRAAEVDKELTKKGDRSKLGTYTWSYSTKDNVAVYNLYTQYRYGTDKQHADYAAIEKAIKAMLEANKGSKEKFGTVRIGCGLAGGDWNIVKGILEKTFADRDVYVYSI